MFWLFRLVSAVAVRALLEVSVAASAVYVEPVEVYAESAVPLAVSIKSLYAVATFTGPVAVSTSLLAVDQTAKESVMVV